MTDDDKFRLVVWVGGVVVTILGTTTVWISKRYTGSKKIKQIEADYERKIKQQEAQYIIFVNEVRNELSLMKRDHENLKTDHSHSKSGLERLEKIYEKIFDTILRLLGGKQ